MRKSKSMRLASGLLVVTMLSTCMISGTFARYTTQDVARDTARVAKWGVELQVAGDLYSTNYSALAGDNVAQTDSNNATVSSYNEANLVAPGTKNEKGLVFSLNGQPEVSGMISATFEYENIYLNSGKYGVMVQYGGSDSDGKMTEETYNTIMNAAGTDNLKKLYTKDADTYSVATAWGVDTVFYTLEDYVELSETYYPVEYQLTGSTKYNDSFDKSLNVDTLAGTVDAIKGALLGTVATATSSVDAGKTTVTYTDVQRFKPNDDLATVCGLSNEAITWKWDYLQNSAATVEGDNAQLTDKADTILGNLMDVSGTTTLKGTVVKERSGSFVAPLAAAGTAANDYNLETSFSMNITVTQVD